jgi:hypothetical protein
VAISISLLIPRKKLIGEYQKIVVKWSSSLPLGEGMLKKRKNA